MSLKDIQNYIGSEEEYEAKRKWMDEHICIIDYMTLLPSLQSNYLKKDEIEKGCENKTDAGETPKA